MMDANEKLMREIAIDYLARYIVMAGYRENGQTLSHAEEAKRVNRFGLACLFDLYRRERSKAGKLVFVKTLKEDFRDWYFQEQKILGVMAA